MYPPRPSLPAAGLRHVRRRLGALLAAGLAGLAFGAGGAQEAGLDFAGVTGGAPVVEKMQEGFGAAEGPASSRLGYLLFTDAPNQRIWKYIPLGSADVFEGGASAAQPGLVAWREGSHGALGLTFDRQGRLLACEQAERRVTRTEKHGAITVLADRFEGRRLNGPDDLIHAIDGSTYFTDPAGRGSELPAAVYQIRRGGGLRRVTAELAAPDGLALSPDQLILYVSDAGRNEIRAYDIVGDGNLANGRVFAALGDPAAGRAGGLKTDVGGNVYCAGPGGVWVFTPAGRHLGTIALPVTPSNLAWGDNFSALYVTAQSALYRVKLKVSGSRTY